MNVYDQAHQLAKAVRESEEFKQFEATKKQIEANPELDQAIKDFMSRQLQIQTAQMMGQEIDQDQQRSRYHDSDQRFFLFFCHDLHPSLRRKSPLFR